MNKLLTIVVPVYKVEQYINKCLDSCILYKTDENNNRVLDEELMNILEVIIVNDGTPDNSAELSREYTKKFPNTFRQIDKENGGHGSAWNVGLNAATGKYLRFLDSDDWLTNLDQLMRKLENCEADLVFTHHLTHYLDTNENVIDYSDGPFENEMCLSKLPISRFVQQHFYASFQRVTCKTSLLKPFFPLFTEKTRYDDSIMSILPLLMGKKYIVFDFVLYNYLIGRGEQTVSKDNLMRFCEQHNAEYGKMYDFAVCNPNEKMNDIVGALIFKAFSDTFSIAIQLPYARRKKCISFLKTKVPLQKRDNLSKNIKRYINWHFIFAYLWDEIRKMKQNFVK